VCQYIKKYVKIETYNLCSTKTSNQRRVRYPTPDTHTCDYIELCHFSNYYLCMVSGVRVCAL